MSNFQKGGGGKPHPNPENNKAENRKISGDVHVRGEVEAKLPPEMVKEYVSSNQKWDRRDDRRFLVEKLTLLSAVLVVVSGVVQSFQSVRAVRLTKESLLAYREHLFFPPLRQSLNLVKTDKKSAKLSSSNGKILARLLLEI
jgi:hypothetical protein